MFYFKPAPDVRKPSFESILKQGTDKNHDGATLVYTSLPLSLPSYYRHIVPMFHVLSMV